MIDVMVPLLGHIVHTSDHTLYYYVLTVLAAEYSTTLSVIPANPQSLEMVLRARPLQSFYLCIFGHCGM